MHVLEQWFHAQVIVTVVATGIATGCNVDLGMNAHKLTGRGFVDRGVWDKRYQKSEGIIRIYPTLYKSSHPQGWGRSAGCLDFVCLFW